MTLVEKRLKKIELDGNVPHALLFVGSKTVQLEKVAYSFVSTLLLKENPDVQKKLEAKTHPDIHFFHPEGRTGMHTMESLKRLSDEVAFLPYEAKRKFLIVSDVERCLPTSSNALLKTLEEPKSESVLILLTTKPEKLLPTIVSRCQKFVFEKSEKETNLYQTKLLECLTSDSPREGLEALTNDLEKERKEWEKKMFRELSKDLPLLQRERMEKEIEGQATLDFQEKVHSLFETFLLWSRDVTLFRMGISSNFLVHPERERAIQKSQPLPYEEVEQMVKQMKMSLERGSSLSHCFEALFLRFGFL
jgi:DNA polymerase-3 subunit delta'